MGEDKALRHIVPVGVHGAVKVVQHLDLGQVIGDGGHLPQGALHRPQQAGGPWGWAFGAWGDLLLPVFTW